MILVGLIISILLHLIVPFPNKGYYSYFIGMGESILITMLIWEGNLRIDSAIDRRISWVKTPVKRIFAQLLFSFTYGMTTLFAVMWFFNEFVCEAEITQTLNFLLITTVIALLTSISILAIGIGYKFFHNWRNSLIELNQYKAASALAQLENLQNQVNPHFLFNNLSVLSSLVYKDQDKAVDFINQLAKVYRYLLDNHNNELITLTEEMNFIHSYVYLLQIRYSPNLHVSIDIPEADLQLYIPPLSLQLLLENAIKHNEISSFSPLHIDIHTSEGRLTIHNNFTPRIHSEPVSGTGLPNIEARYRYFTDKPIEVVATDSDFSVHIPLIHLS